MVTLSEIARWLYYRISELYLRLARVLLRRDRLVVGTERKFRSLLEAAPDATVIINWHGHVALVNAAAERLFGYPRQQIVGQSVAILVPERHRALFRHRLKTYLSAPEQRAVGDLPELLGRRSDGDEFPAEIGLSPLGTEQGLLVSAVVRDVSKHRSVEARLRHLADHDGLTGLLNRRAFEENLAREVAMALRHGHEGTMVMFDIDGLKDVNDTLGHALGDELIRTVAELIRSRFRETDIVARIGGDEFAVLMTSTEADAASAVAAEMLEAIRDAGVAIGTQRLRPSACAGLAGFEHGNGAASEVMVAADLALYEAKEGGRARLAVYAPKADEAARRETRATWSQRIRHGLDENLFVPYRQPILDLATNEVNRYELLARLIDEHGRPILPGAFLPIAERTGLVRELDRQMVCEAIDLIAANGNGTAARPLSYEVNLSARTLADREMPQMIAGWIERAGIDPGLLVFEITETTAIANMEQARDFATSLRRLGCRFALDDFGAGFASFLYLKHLPLDALKIDGDFIRKLRTNRIDQLLVKHMAEIARSMELFTIAEYVEDASTLELLDDYAIDAAQGFTVGRPEPARQDGVVLPPPPEAIHLAEGE